MKAVTAEFYQFSFQFFSFSIRITISIPMKIAANFNKIATYQNIFLHLYCLVYYPELLTEWVSNVTQIDFHSR